MQNLSAGLDHISLKNPQLPFNPAKLTEGILALSDMAVMLTGPAQQILYCSRSINPLLGIASENFTAGGWNYFFSQINPSDKKSLDRQLFPSLRTTLNGLSESQRKTCVFCYTTRMRHANGNDVIVAVENQPMEWKKGSWPSTYMTILKNITPFADKSKMILTVSTRGEDNRYKDIHKEEFDFRFDPFSPREVEVMRMIAGGFTSSEMADKLFLSPETVRNHRKNIRKKSGCSTNAQLAAFIAGKGMM
jgi:DNA-binding CsgD family transcriptional regulator